MSCSAPSDACGARAATAPRSDPLSAPRPHGPGESVEVTAGELAKSADLNPASVTAMLDQLEANGIVERRRDAQDRRVCLVSLTGAGRAIVEEKRARWQALWDAQLGDLSEQELVAALRVMRTMTRLLEGL